MFNIIKQFCGSGIRGLWQRHSEDVMAFYGCPNLWCSMFVLTCDAEVFMREICAVVHCGLQHLRPDNRYAFLFAIWSQPQETKLMSTL